MKASLIILIAIWIVIFGVVVVRIFSKKSIFEKRQNEKFVNEKQEENEGLPDYNFYRMTRNEKIGYFFIGALCIFIVAYIFYRSILASLLLVPLASFYIPYRTKEIIKKRKEDLNIQFKEALYAVSSSLSAGRSIEIAFKEALKDISILYPDQNTFIVKELECINRRLDMNDTIESALKDFAERAHLEDVNNFVDVFKTCKRSGGNLIQVIKNTSDIISDKISTKLEISAMLAQRKFEQKILSVLPIAMIFLISATSPEFIEPIYVRIAGKVVMTAALILIAVASLLSNKIMDIEV